MQKILNQIQPGIKVLSIKKIKVAGLCEVVIKFGGTRKSLFYTDSTGRYIITGRIFDLVTKRNITGERLAELNKRFLNKKQLAKLDKMVDFTYGNSSRAIYFIVDPDCPYCKRAEAIINQLVQEGKLKVKVILLPLERLHPQAKKKAVAIICDKKGFKGLLMSYSSENQCKSGKDKIKRNIKFLMNELKIYATPTFVFPDGEIRSGVLPRYYILDKLKKLARGS
jgi:thiol:disulfide interchange protein DsbC